ncbi:CbiX/SirB N-terminal domain-containing protein [Ideonella sp. 4Y16]|uniref:sirohydrochlorin chelatase n=1 Tax=Ideonella alba TaxID=2824118 RepID=UPI001B3867DA|nr:CbiX/SirB N-terminal domain-containing protein [Ideonella alba]MBQ0946571.1 CbiX/SirB N-terminal domain-containing protein [Ideonella alba]
MRGLILLAHGARDPAWSRPFVELAARVRTEHPGREVRNAYLEFVAPDMVEAGAELARAGCHAVDILPLFLGAGGHVRKDVPALLQRLQADWPAVHWMLHPAVGESPLMIDAMARIAGGLHDAAALSREERA